MKNISKKPFVPVYRSLQAVPAYRIAWAAEPPLLSAEWDSPTWAAGQTIPVDQFHPNSSAHRPRTEAKVLYDAQGLYVSFRSLDRYVKCVHTTYQSLVSQDSCVEFFVQPTPQGGYFNFEMNCGGTMLLFYIEDATKVEGSLFRKYQEVSPEFAQHIRTYHSLPEVIRDEIQEPIEWRVASFIPFSLMERFVGPLTDLHSRSWRGNFFKCADATSHPHWASWAPIGELLRFHQPEYFGALEFGPPSNPVSRENLRRG